MRKKVTYFRDWEQMPLDLSPEDVALLMGKNVQIIRKYAREKIIPATKVGKCWHFNREAIRKIIEGGNELCLQHLKPSQYSTSRSSA